MAGDEQSNASDTVTGILLANHKRFLSFLVSRVGSRADAEEILQNAFVRSLKKADAIRSSETAVAWFYRLLRNAVIDHHRRNAAGNRMLESFARGLSDADGGTDPAMQNVICECVRRLVPALRTEHAELITRVDLEGDEVAKAADSLGLTPGNARVRLHRARKALRNEVERTCRTCATHGCMDCTCAGSAETPVAGS